MLVSNDETEGQWQHQSRTSLVSEYVFRVTTARWFLRRASNRVYTSGSTLVVCASLIHLFSMGTLRYSSFGHITACQMGWPNALSVHLSFW